MLLEKLEIPEEIDTPYICLDPETGVCEIKGKSYPEDITAFYSQVLDWFDEYSLLGKEDIVLSMDLTYFNSSSQKMYTEIFGRLMDTPNFNVKIKWYYDEDDDEILENGKIYQNLTDLEFEFIAY